jgi:hypothetical protein
MGALGYFDIIRAKAGGACHRAFGHVLQHAPPSEI